MHGTTIPYFTGKMLIGGELVESKDGGWLESINPADETQLGRVPMGTAADMSAAVEAAEKAQPAWAALTIAQRAEYIHKLGDALMARQEEIARIESLDTGNTLGPMKRDVRTAVERMRFAAGLAYEVKGETVPSTPGNIHMTIRTPYGVIGRIIPFNHPIGFAASRIAPAIISGNAIVVKPSEQSPLSSSILGEICKQIMPPGVVNIVTGGRETGETLVRHPRVKRIAFIGQPASGMAIQKAAAETAVKHVTLELGGKNPLIAFADADIEKVAQSAVGGMNFGWQGQSCGSMSRILLHEIDPRRGARKNSRARAQDQNRPSARSRDQHGADQQQATIRQGPVLYRPREEGRREAAARRRRAPGRRVQARLLDRADGVRRRQHVDAHRQGRGVRPRHVGAEILAPTPKRSPWPTASSSVSPRPSGPTTSTARSRSRKPCRPAISGSTASASIIAACLMAASRIPASAARKASASF